MSQTIPLQQSNHSRRKKESTQVLASTRCDLKNQNDRKFVWKAGPVGYLVILHHALFHKNDNQCTNTSIVQATGSYLVLLLLPAKHIMQSNRTAVTK